MGVFFVKPDGTFAGRFMAGIGISMGLGRERQKMQNASWGILTAQGGEFIVPDNFAAYGFMPVSPNICLAARLPDQTIGIESISVINGLAIHGSQRYYFARELTRCPVKKVMPLLIGECIRLGEFGHAHL